MNKLLSLTSQFVLIFSLISTANAMEQQDPEQSNPQTPHIKPEAGKPTERKAWWEGMTEEEAANSIMNMIQSNIEGKKSSPEGFQLLFLLEESLGKKLPDNILNRVNERFEQLYPELAKEAKKKYEEEFNKNL